MAQKYNFQIKEERLDIKKNQIPTQEVLWHKETVVEQKTVAVEVLREELVIERRYLNPDSPDQILNTEMIRIPLREEKLEICKQPYTLEEVKIYKILKERNYPAIALTKKEVVSVKTGQD